MLLLYYFKKGRRRRTVQVQVAVKSIQTTRLSLGTIDHRRFVRILSCVTTMEHFFEHLLFSSNENQYIQPIMACSLNLRRHCIFHLLTQIILLLLHFSHWFYLRKSSRVHPTVHRVLSKRKNTLYDCFVIIPCAGPINQYISKSRS